MRERWQNLCQFLYLNWSHPTLDQLEEQPHTAKRPIWLLCRTVLLVLCIGVLSVLSFRSAAQLIDLTQLSEQAEPAQRLASRLGQHLNDVEVAVRLYLASDDPSLHRPYADALQLVGQDLAILRKEAAQAPAARTFINNLDALTQHRLAVVDQFADFDTAQPMIDRHSSTRASTITAALNDIRQGIQDFNEAINGAQRVRLAQARRKVNHALVAIACGSLLACLSVIVAHTLVRTEARRAQRLEDLLSNRHSCLSAVLEAVDDPLLILDAELRIRACSRAFLDHFHFSLKDIMNERLVDLNGGTWDNPSLQELLAATLNSEASLPAVEFDLPAERIACDARRVLLEGTGTPIVLMTVTPLPAETVPTELPPVVPRRLSAEAVTKALSETVVS